MTPERIKQLQQGGRMAFPHAPGIAVEPSDFVAEVVPALTWAELRELLALAERQALSAQGYHVDAHSFLSGAFARQSADGQWRFEPPSVAREEKAVEALNAFIEWWKPKREGATS